MWHFDTNKFLPHAKNYRDARKTHLLPTWALKLQYWNTWFDRICRHWRRVRKWASPSLNHTSTVSTGSPSAVGLPEEQGSKDTCVWGHPLWLMELWCCRGRLGRCRVSLHLLHLLWSSCCTWKNTAQLALHSWKAHVTGSDWLKGSYLSVQEAVEYSHHEPLTKARREQASERCSIGC